MTSAGALVTLVAIVALDLAYTRRVGRGPDFATYALFGAFAGAAGYAFSHVSG